jgi:hypothetical protein
MRTTRYVAGVIALLSLAACENVTGPPPNASKDPAVPRLQTGEDPETTRCEGVLAGAHENVVVPRGANCFLVLATVSGNVRALENASLSLFDSRVEGDVIGNGADLMQIARVTIGGNLRIRNGGPFPTPGVDDVALCGLDVRRNVIIEFMTGTINVGPGFCGSPTPNIFRATLYVSNNVVPAGDHLTVNGNTVIRNATVFANEGPGAKSVQGNIVGRTLYCSENADPFVGGPNAALFNEGGQCF